MDLVETLTRLGGVASTADLVAVSSRRKVRTAIGRGEVVRVGRDRLALPVREQGVRAARALNGYLSHAGAASHHDWEIWCQPDLPHVILPRGRSVPEELSELAEIGVRDLPLADRDGWATSHLRTVLDCARDLGFADALAVADSALRHGDLTAEGLEAAARLTGRTSDRAKRVLLHADARAANPFESALRALAIQAGLEVIPQYETRCGGLVLHPDLADPIRGIVIEADSWTWHAEKWDHDRDCARYNAMTCAGWLVLRFTWEQVMHTPQLVVATIRALRAEAA